MHPHYKQMNTDVKIDSHFNQLTKVILVQIFKKEVHLL